MVKIENEDGRSGNQYVHTGNLHGAYPDAFDTGAGQRGYQRERAVHDSGYGYQDGGYRLTHHGHGHRQQHDDGAIDDNCSRRHHNHIGKQKITRKAPEVIHHQRRCFHLRCKRYGRHAPEGTCEPVPDGDEAEQEAIEQQYAQHGHERQLKAYVPKAHGVG